MLCGHVLGFSVSLGLLLGLFRLVFALVGPCVGPFVGPFVGPLLLRIFVGHFLLGLLLRLLLGLLLLNSTPLLLALAPTHSPAARASADSQHLNSLAARGSAFVLGEQVPLGAALEAQQAHA